jgi:hypothetical protein
VLSGVEGSGAALDAGMVIFSPLTLTLARGLRALWRRSASSARHLT